MHAAEQPAWLLEVEVAHAVKFDVVCWCGVVCCGVTWCAVVWCGRVWSGVVWCGVMRCGDAVQS